VKLLAARAVQPTAWDALCHYLHDWAEFRLGMLHDPVCESLPDGMAVDADLRDAQLAFWELFIELIADAHAEGRLRRDVGVREVAEFMNMLVIRTEPGDTTTKLLEVMIDGLRCTA
jgi:hypothetical protein